jgi:hypothetical protein
VRRDEPVVHSDLDAAGALFANTKSYVLSGRMILLQEL